MCLVQELLRGGGGVERAMCLVQGLQGEVELRGRMSSTGATGGGGIEGPCV